MASNPAALGTPADGVFPAGRPFADAVFAPIFGESAFQAADFPTGRAFLGVHVGFLSFSQSSDSDRSVQHPIVIYRLHS